MRWRKPFSAPGFKEILFFYCLSLAFPQPGDPIHDARILMLTADADIVAEDFLRWFGKPDVGRALKSRVLKWYASCQREDCLAVSNLYLFGAKFNREARHAEVFA